MDSLGEMNIRLPTYQIGKLTLPVSMNLFQLNRNRLKEKLEQLVPDSFVFLAGGKGLNVYNTDIEYTFRQEPYFHWMFGVRHPSFYGGLDVKSGESILFIPRLPQEYCIWMGKLVEPTEVRDMYGVSKVYYEDEMENVLTSLSPASLLVLAGHNTDSDLFLQPPEIPFKHNFKVDKTTLHPIMTELRVIKTNMEIALIREANRISSNAHKFVMQRLTLAGYSEYQAESMFLHYCYFMGGCRTTAYTCICGSGDNSAILHYGHAAAPNDKEILDGDMCLFDMGASYYGYASDITVSFPANGRFTNKQLKVYNAVLKARDRALQLTKPGASWADIHLEANKAMFEEMKVGQLLKGDVDEMISAELGRIFQPHGLGHLMGIDVHDVGGYTSKTPPRPQRAALKNLRTARILEKGMVLTIEPGCYFIDHLLNEAYSSPELNKFINPGVLREFRGFGGVRIEDNVVVTETGCELLTTVPRTPEEIERFMAMDNVGSDEYNEEISSDIRRSCHCFAYFSGINKQSP